MAETVIGAAALNRRLAAVSGGQFGIKVMRTLGLATVREAKLLAKPHRKTSNLEHSIHVQSTTETTALVVASAKYAAFVELGTRPHEITPNAAKALRFAATPGGRRLSGAPRKGAAVVFAKRVHHPGTKPYPYLVPGAKRAVKTAGLSDTVVKLWNDAA